MSIFSTIYDRVIVYNCIDGEVGSQHHNAVDEAYAETRHLLGPLLDVLGEGEIVQNRDSGLVDRSQSGGDKAGDLS